MSSDHREDHSHLIWHEEERTLLPDARIFQVSHSRRRAADGRERTYVLVDSAARLDRWKARRSNAPAGPLH